MLPDGMSTLEIQYRVMSRKGRLKHGEQKEKNPRMKENGPCRYSVTLMEK